MTPEQVAGVTAAATSPDGLVTAVAGALGDLRELRLDPRHQRNRDANALAATIVATVRAAAEAAARASFRELAPQLPPGTRFEDADLLCGPILYGFDASARGRSR